MSRLQDLQREAEWRLCKRDVRYFLENYWHIEFVVPTGFGTFRKAGWRLFELRDYQVEDLELINRAMQGDADAMRQVWLKARQVGQTTLVVACAFHDIFFNDDHQWLVAAQTEDDAKKTLLNRVKVPYRMLPEWMRQRGPALETENMEEMRFENGSVIEVIPATGAAGRGGSRHGMIFDETAFVENAGELFAAVEPQTYGPMFVFSTANGMGNWFHETWLDTEKSDSEWIGNFHPWHVVPGRDERWYERMKRRMRATPHLFYQENPATPAEAFAKSGRTAFNLELLDEQMCWCDPSSRYDISLIDYTNPDYDAALEDAYLLGGDADLELWVWEHPYVERDEDGFLLRNPNFVVFADVAEGLEHGDRSAVAVMDANTGEVVATMLSHIPVENLGEFLEWLGYYYFTALVMVERNQAGMVPVVDIQRAGYPRQYRMEKFGERPVGKSGKYRQRYGWHTNASTKPKMVHDFNRALADEAVLLHDERFMHEARTFIADGKGGFGAAVGSHDDHVIAHMGAYQGIINVGEYPVVWRDPEPGPVTMGEVMALTNQAPQRNLDNYLGSEGNRSGVVQSFIVPRS